MKPPCDVLILGGGPAGLSAALVAGRARLSTRVFAGGQPRNAVTRASHGLFTRDGVHPLELQDLAIGQLAPYSSVTLTRTRVLSVGRQDGVFEVVDEHGERWRGRRIVIATGFRDELAGLGLPGIEAVYGMSVFPCPFCDGFEHADQRVALFGGDSALFLAPVVRVWATDLVVFTNAQPLAPEGRETLQSKGVVVEDAPVVRLHHDQGTLTAVELQGGRRIERDAGFIADEYSVPSTPFADQLGVASRVNDWGMTELDAEPNGRTPIPGVYVVGDARSGFSGLTAAANDGSLCMSEIVHEIATERWSAA